MCVRFELRGAKRSARITLVWRKYDDVKRQNDKNVVLSGAKKEKRRDRLAR
jgi:hypothetical protein